MEIPEEHIGVGQEHLPNVYIKRSANIGIQTIDPDRILETDLLRWLLLIGQENRKVVNLVRERLKKRTFIFRFVKKFLKSILIDMKKGNFCHLLSLAIDLNEAEGQLVLSDLVQKR